MEWNCWVSFDFVSARVEPETVEHWNQTWNCVGGRKREAIPGIFLRKTTRRGRQHPSREISIFIAKDITRTMRM